MTEEIKKIMADMEEHLDKAISHLELELAKIRAGKANPHILDGVHVDYYGTNTPLFQVSSINTPDAKSIVIQPWEKNMLGPIEKAIQAANLGFNPQSDGEMVRIPIPMLTEERRKDLIKVLKNIGEKNKVSVRNIRREANDELKKLVKDKKISEDENKLFEKNIQKITDDHISNIDKILIEKEKEILQV